MEKHLEKHPLWLAIETACAHGLDFYLLVGGTPALRQKMGLPAAVAEENPLFLAFQAAYFRHSRPQGDEHGLHCVLSFDALYTCRIPWSAVKRLMLLNGGDESWPEEWDEETPSLAPTPPPPPDNVRALRPRRKPEPSKKTD